MMVEVKRVLEPVTKCSGPEPMNSHGGLGLAIKSLTKVVVFFKVVTYYFFFFTSKF
jgi:hypothetical protein